VDRAPQRRETREHLVERLAFSLASAALDHAVASPGHRDALARRNLLDRAVDVARLRVHGDRRGGRIDLEGLVRRKAERDRGEQVDDLPVVERPRNLFNVPRAYRFAAFP